MAAATAAKRLFEFGTPLLKAAYQRTLAAFPEFKSGVPSDGRYVMGGFGALGTPSSFHNEHVRVYRQWCHALLVEHLFRDFIRMMDDPTTVRLEQIMDRMMHRKAGDVGPNEAWHRDEAPAALNGDIILGGWINLSDGDQSFHYVPGTHNRSFRERGRSGFNKIRKEDYADCKSKSEIAVVRPGDIIVFFEDVIHSTVGKASRVDNIRLFLGWRLTRSSDPLIPNMRELLDQQAVMPLKSGQTPPMFANLHWTNHRAKLSAWAENLHPACTEFKMVRSGLAAGTVLRVPKRHMASLGAMGFIKFENYGYDERSIYYPGTSWRLLKPGTSPSVYSMLSVPMMAQTCKVPKALTSTESTCDQSTPRVWTFEKHTDNLEAVPRNACQCFSAKEHNELTFVERGHVSGVETRCASSVRAASTQYYQDTCFYECSSICANACILFTDGHTLRPTPQFKAFSIGSYQNSVTDEMGLFLSDDPMAGDGKFEHSLTACHTCSPLGESFVFISIDKESITREAAKVVLMLLEVEVVPTIIYENALYEASRAVDLVTQLTSASPTQKPRNVLDLQLHPRVTQASQGQDLQARQEITAAPQLPQEQTTLMGADGMTPAYSSFTGSAQPVSSGESEFKRPKASSIEDSLKLLQEQRKREIETASTAGPRRELPPPQAV
ncbi:hypothetical protein M427DRAFT_45211 [Gonapodya prolifera JEL478]|uniref:Phytanoyl-CoA dioxygenase n=1 Tax=Gonapodya prolifera (strain JEL478) TaxID=1344416 RepID=A0A139ACB9_GONPJ|nr:hypothetical protein M427DRAFT_45211 [Gonapodya prolifera JEL478]|eukprot:KXS14115.1 hypothetical protein M427DRAFT_45211 [Gonapodya prolifera JEL478]